MVRLLKGIKILGATTAGAAKLPSVLKVSTYPSMYFVRWLRHQGFAPKVLVIEEAGQVLEAHILATLFPTIQHVIALGDPLQLRPQVNQHGIA